MEAWMDSLCRAATPRRRPGSGGTNRRQPTWPLAAREQPGAHLCLANCVPQLTRPGFRRGTEARIIAEPPYTDPYVRWCGRGGVARLPPIPIAMTRENGIASNNPLGLQPLNRLGII